MIESVYSNNNCIIGLKPIKYKKELLVKGFLKPEYSNKVKIFDSFNNNEYEIVNKQRYLLSKRKCNFILAYDVETYKGTCKLLASYSNHKKRYIIKEKQETNSKFLLRCLNFLFYKSSKGFGYRFFFNIDFDISAILKLYRNNKKIEKLSKGIEVIIKGYKLYWLKGKFFRMRKGHKTIFLCDIFNFFHVSLQKASKNFLNREKSDKIDGSMLNTSLFYWKQNLEKITKYCLKDCKLTYKLSKLIIDTISKCKISLPKLLVSAGSLAKADFRSNCWMTNLKNIPKKIVQIAYDCYFGGKFEIQKRGYFSNLYLYDINSQYPNYIKEMYDLAYGVWEKIKYIPENECVGYFKVDLDIPKDLEISTIPYRLENNMIISVCGNIRNKWLTWYDLDLMRDYVIKIHKGYLFLPTRQEKEVNNDKIKYVKPFKERITFHYQKKAKYKNVNQMKYNLHKLTMNALYGSFIERHKNLDKKGVEHYSVGILFNPIYASQITAYGRWSVIKDIPKAKWKYIVAIHTDSIISKISLESYLNIGRDIGQWSLEKKGKGIVINTGIYQIGDLIKTRGIPINLVKDLFLLCKEHALDKEVNFTFNKMLKISESFVRFKNIEKVNTFQEYVRTLNVNQEYKRTWLSKFENFRDLSNRCINSYLLCLNMKDNESFVGFDNVYKNPLIFE